jgi:hypothetical protein
MITTYIQAIALVDKREEFTRNKYITTSSATFHEAGK